ncbi:unnamed protein product [Heligmosomoides polygyrus]|uniref:Uncharacterized protein n=1 Tax=Heligmosomoides polygyrus TaxID=6339 RepID=A0A183GG51_HELPZ|nr:unnamed protein product [Heligmosomoides polygyrus]
MNKDPTIDRILITAAQKITKDFSEVLENDKCSRSIVISGLEETLQELPPSERQGILKMKPPKCLTC